MLPRSVWCEMDHGEATTTHNAEDTTPALLASREQGLFGHVQH